MTMRASRNGDQFGKRGRVSVTPPVQQRAATTGQAVSPMKWIGGGLAAVALVALLIGGTGGSGGLLGGILGGMLGRHLANRAVTPPTSTAAHAQSQSPQRAAPSTTVQRSGFGSTGSSAGFSSGT